MFAGLHPEQTQRGVGGMATVKTEGVARHGSHTANHIHSHQSNTKPNKAIAILILHVDTRKESLECMEEASTIEYKLFRLKLSPD